MKEEEFYIEESNPRRIKIIIFVIILIIAIGSMGFIYYQKTYTLNLKNKITFEAGEKISYDITDYVVNKVVDENDYSLNFKGIPLNDDVLTTVGEYSYKVNYKNITKKGTLIVKDTTKPIVDVQELTIGVSEEFELDEFLVSCEDLSMPCTVAFKNENDTNLKNKAGNYTFDIVISDAYNNKTTKKVRLNVKDGYSRESMKKKDLVPHHIEPANDDWNNQMVLTYTEGVDGNHLDDDERYVYLLELASEDLNSYLPAIYQGNVIINQEIIFVYNQYNYVIGFGIKVTLDNGVVLYLEK